MESLEKCIELRIAGKDDIVQLRGQKRLMTYCTVKNGVVEGFAKVTLNGVGARVYVDGKSWGFSSTNRSDFDSVKQTLENAVTLGRASSTFKHKKLMLEPTKTVEEETTIPIKKPPRDLSTQETVEIPMEAYRGAKQAGSHVADIETTYISMEDDKYFLSSEGSRIRQETAKVLLFVNVIAKKGGAICPASENLAHAGGIELFDEHAPFSMGKAVAENAVKLLDAPASPSGKLQVIIHPTLCATLLHEAIGHPLEADLALSGGGFGSQLNQKVSSPLVTIYDDGRVSRGLGYFAYDDEGVECRRTDLIKAGELRSFMHDRTSATLTRAPVTGNSHAWDYSVEPLIRQTNIGLEPGGWSIEEMIEDVKEGLLLEGTFGGQADVNADFTFGFQNARQIRKGRVEEETRGANVAGNAIEVFNTIDAISKEDVLRPGACGKSQFAIQGRIAPAIRCEILVGGSGGR
jgi:TldD protein